MVLRGPPNTAGLLDLGTVGIFFSLGVKMAIPNVVFLELFAYFGTNNVYNLVGRFSIKNG